MATKLSPKMEQRRENILRAARTLILRDGFDALTTRRLADEAGITAPTLYNLIGDKSEIIRQLVSDGVARVGSRVTLGDDLPPLAMAEGIIETALAVVAEDEAYYRAVVIASDRVPGSFAVAGDGPASVANAAQVSIDMMMAACRAAIGARLLEGHVAAETLGQQTFIGFRGPFRDWANQLISLSEFRHRALRGLYLALAIDATLEFRDVLRAKIIALEPPFRTGLEEAA